MCFMFVDFMFVDFGCVVWMVAVIYLGCVVVGDLVFSCLYIGERCWMEGLAKMHLVARILGFIAPMARCKILPVG